MQTHIFYSWQSDLPKPTNSSLIRRAITDATSTIESENTMLEFKLNEAARDFSGSPSLPDAIFFGIRNADIFICDISTIANSVAGRKFPNPNVLIELGYAIAHLGWSRIIMIMNSDYGRGEDAPFDINKHKITSYKVQDGRDKGGYNTLVGLVRKEIEKIIRENPVRTLLINPEDKKRVRDIKNLTTLMSTIDIAVIDRYLKSMPSKFHWEIASQYNMFGNVIESRTFHLYNEELKQLIQQFRQKWSDSFMPDYYNQVGVSEVYKFNTGTNADHRSYLMQEYKLIMEALRDMRRLFDELLDYIRTNYLEIDLAETSIQAGIIAHIL